MKIVSINLNKRLNDPDRRFVHWLSLQAPSVLIVQESVAVGQPLPPILCDLSLVGGDDRVACWAKPGIARKLETCAVPALLIETETLVICTTYLSPYSSKRRVAQVEELHRFLLNRAKPIVLAGDFNTALTLGDGLYGDDFSRWTSAGERSALQRLSIGLGVTDLTSRHRLGEQHFTFERPIRGKWSRFRCDLAFAPATPGFGAYYDHDVRNGPHAFTDHSACIIDLDTGQEPCGIPAPRLFMAEPSATLPSPPVTIQSHNTAISRTEPSKPVRDLVKSGALGRWGVRTILDYGCGYGADAEHLASLGFSVVGYDRHPKFQRTLLLADRFDLVLLLYVLNVLPSPLERLDALRECARCLQSGGRLLIVARSESEIEREAAAKGWPPHADGYLSNARRGMFQHGMSRAELEALARQAGLHPAKEAGPVIGAGVALLALRIDFD